MTQRRSFFALTLALGMASGMLLARSVGSTPQTGAYTWFDPIVDVHRLVVDRFVETPDTEAMQREAIDGMLEALNDRYTEFISASQTDDFEKATQGRYVGIGASVTMRDGLPTIISPLQGSPAFDAGITAGDQIVAVDGESTMGESLQDAIDMLSGEPGTPVTVTIERDGERFDVRILRERIVARSVEGWTREGEQWRYMIDPARGIGYVRLARFAGQTAAELREAIERMQAQGLQALVLDMRFNPGGLLSAAVEIADMFLEEGLIVSTRGRAHEEQSAYATDEEDYGELPLVVLVNRRSASASEVVAGALRDNDRAIVIGTRTFGKGAVQNVIALPSGAGQLKITEQHYYGPSGRKIHREDDATVWGVDPSPGFFVPMTDQEYNDMLTVQQEQSVIRNGDGPNLTPATDGGIEWIREDLKDPQLAGAVEAAQLRLDRGKWVPTGEEAVEDGVEMAELARMREAKRNLLRNLERAQRRIDALEQVAPEPETPPVIPEGAALAGGRLEIYGADGELVTTLRIREDGLAPWLADAPLEPIAEDAPANR